jgi:hypothetical protein
MEYRLRRHDGEFRWLIDNGVPRYGPGGEFEGFIGSCLDVTDYKNAAAALQDADRRKDEFLATLAHELRNPLAPISNGLHIMRLAGATGMVEQARTMMERQLTQLVRLVDDLLDLSRVTSGKLELRRDCVDLRAVIDAAIETSRPAIEQAGHELTVTLPDEPILLDGDATRLSQVVSNLLNNSAKYTNRGGPCPAGRPPRRQPGGAGGHRRRDRHPARDARKGIRDVHPGGPLAGESDERLGDRALAGEAGGRDARRNHRGPERRRRAGQRVHRAPAGAVVSRTDDGVARLPTGWTVRPAAAAFSSPMTMSTRRNRCGDCSSCWGTTCAPRMTACRR